MKLTEVDETNNAKVGFFFFFAKNKNFTDNCQFTFNEPLEKPFSLRSLYAATKEFCVIFAHACELSIGSIEYVKTCDGS